MAHALKRRVTTVALVSEQVWTPQLAAALNQVADQLTPLDWYRDGVVYGALKVEAVYAEGGRVGFALWRLDHYAGGRAFVVVAAVGHHKAFDLIGSVLPKLEAMARSMGCVAARFHTARPGLVRVAQCHGYSPAEFVLRKML